jgi:hypothetical protein
MNDNELPDIQGRRQCSAYSRALRHAIGFTVSPAASCKLVFVQRPSEPMALDVKPPKPAANFAIKAATSSAAGLTLRMSARSPLPGFRKLLTWAALLASATLIPAYLVFVFLKSGIGNLPITQASVEGPSSSNTTGDQRPGRQRFFVDRDSRRIGETIISRNGRGTIEREESAFSDGTSQITSYDYDPRQRRLRITVYNRDGSTSAKSYMIDPRKR